MNKFIEYLETWLTTNETYFRSKNIISLITGVLGDSNKARYIELDGNGLLTRATIWETGDLVIEAIDIESTVTIILTHLEVRNLPQLHNQLNWWRNKIAKYKNQN
jgi:hypothetical protein